MNKGKNLISRYNMGFDKLVFLESEVSKFSACL